VPAELIALTDELQATRQMLTMLVDRLDAADRRARRHRFGTFLLALCLVAVTALGVLFWNNQRTAADRSCTDRRDARLVLRELVELSDDGDGFNLTGFDSFKELDPATQRYLSDLEAASKQAPQPSEFVQHALALLDIPDCA
jgi:hypothetical protein